MVDAESMSHSGTSVMGYQVKAIVAIVIPASVPTSVLYMHDANLATYTT